MRTEELAATATVTSSAHVCQAFPAEGVSSSIRVSSCDTFFKLSEIIDLNELILFERLLPRNFYPPANEVSGKVIFSEASDWGSQYDVTPYLAAWFHGPSGGSLSLIPCSFQGVSVQGGLCPRRLCPGGPCHEGGCCQEGALCLRVSVQGGLCQGPVKEGGLPDSLLPGHRPSWTEIPGKTGQYASYWNAFNC